MYSKLTLVRPRVLTPFGDTFEDPFGWTDKCPSGTGQVPVAITISDMGEASSVYFAVSLVANTQYTFSGSGQNSQARIDVYDAAGTRVAYNEGSYVEEPEWAWVMPDCIYTPTVSGEYVFRVTDGSEMGDMGDTYMVSVTPRPEPLTKTGPTPYEKSAGAMVPGCRDYRRVAAEAGIAEFDLWGLYDKLQLRWEDFLLWLRKHYYPYYVWFIRTLIWAPMTGYSQKDELGNIIEYSEPDYAWGSIDINGRQALQHLATGYDLVDVILRAPRGVSHLNSFHLSFDFWFQFDPDHRRQSGIDPHSIRILSNWICYTGRPPVSRPDKAPYLSVGGMQYPVTLQKNRLHNIQITKKNTTLDVYLNGVQVYSSSYLPGPSGHNQYFNSLHFTYQYAYPDSPEPKSGQGVTNVYFNGTYGSLRVRPM